MFPNSSWRFGVHYYNLQSILPSLLPLLGFCAPASLITCWPSLAAEHTNTHTHTLAHSHTHTHTLSLSQSLALSLAVSSFITSALSLSLRSLSIQHLCTCSHSRMAYQRLPPHECLHRPSYRHMCLYRPSSSLGYSILSLALSVCLLQNCLIHELHGALYS